MQAVAHSFVLDLTVNDILTFETFDLEKQVKVIRCEFRSSIVRCQWQVYKSINVVLCISRCHRFRDINILNVRLSKSRSSSEYNFRNEPFDGKCQNLQTIAAHFCASFYRYILRFVMFDLQKVGQGHRV